MTTSTMPARPGLTSYTHAAREPIGTDALYTVIGHHAEDRLIVDDVIDGPLADDAHLRNGAWCDQLAVARGTSVDKVNQAANDFAALLAQVVHRGRDPRFKDPMTGGVFVAARPSSGKVIAYFDRETAATALQRDGLYDVRIGSDGTMLAKPLSLAQMYFPGEHQSVEVHPDQQGNYDLSQLGWGFALV